MMPTIKHRFGVYKGMYQLLYIRPMVQSIVCVPMRLLPIFELYMIISLPDLVMLVKLRDHC